ncbi:MAG: N-acetylglucosamine-6-phosphate deacetylase [Chloroflexota bacterium]|nr:N-acetylglucosamine-6-phosphate deacetylase [Chloroflexota bacterium]
MSGRANRTPSDVITGRLVLADGIRAGRLQVRDGLISRLELDDEADGRLADGELDAASWPYVLPGFVDIHVHGWGGHSAMGGRAALDGMARALLRRGVTSFLPTAVTASLDDLHSFAADVRSWLPSAPDDGARPLGFNLEGPFLAPDKRGAHDARHLLSPADVDNGRLEPLVDGLRVITIAPELPGARELIAWLVARGVVVSLGHSAASAEIAAEAYVLGATSTTHLFNAMSGVDHRAPGLAVAALTNDDAYVELIADGHHVHRSLWRLIARLKPGREEAGGLLLVSDALPLAGSGAARGFVGGLEVEVVGDRVTLAGSDTLAGSLIALDSAVRNFAMQGATLANASMAASRNPLSMLGIVDRGWLEAGQHADLVEMDELLRVRRVMRGGEWFGGAGEL